MTNAQRLELIRLTRPDLWANDAEPCCGRSPTLRVCTANGTWYVAYQCRVCDHWGGLSITGREALEMWP